jgi:hypothetical protein
MRVSARAITDKKHIRYPCVVYLSLTITIGGVNKQIDNSLLVDFISSSPFISLCLIFSITHQFTS